MKPELAKSAMLGKWYVVTEWNADGSARRKFDVDEQVKKIIADHRVTTADVLFDEKVVRTIVKTIIDHNISEDTMISILSIIGRLADCGVSYERIRDQLIVLFPSGEAHA